MHQAALTLIDDVVTQHRIQHLYVAYSGGVDSTALVHLVTQLKSNIHIHAIHIHHGLSENADHWLDICQTQAAQLNIAFITHRLSPPLKRNNIESWARTERYAFFESVMQKTPNSLLLTAHHIEDQAETFLLQALRGSGLKGLAAIAKQKTFANGLLLRPFLDLRKRELIEYCQSHHLIWIEDESNQSTDFRRNAIRHNIMPNLREILPQADMTLTRSAELCAEADRLIDELLAPYLAKIMTENRLDLFKFKKHSPLQQKQLLKMWLTLHKLYPSQVQFLQIYAGTQSMHGNWHYTLTENHLSITKGYLVINESNISSASLTVTTMDILHWLNKQQQTTFTLNDLIIRPRQAGDRCRPLYRHKSQSLKVIFQEQGIPAKDRTNARIIALMTSPDHIIAVYPFFICH
ncbi:tRNA lysidine(34) synthetase TilS [Cysteiniphilum halobium]|uniref:tRNA lysidine(34) synthetase TilS n=1 Tax=Cysteiniphilum halobium TaxID=2219059 RepID=UPI000E6556D3|nr:tRNA lysidine(34) synthetase TilS [Cysteiniphilum halobium]